MSNSKLLRRISIESPCSVRWDEMKGNEQVRFCGHCDLNVTDVSQMTRSRAVKLVRRSEGRLCLRIHRTPLGEVLTLPAVKKVHTIARRATRFAAGAFGAMVTLSTAAYAQSTTNPPANDEPPVAQQTVDGPINGDGPVVTVPQVLGGVMVMTRYEQPLVRAVHDGEYEEVDRLLAQGEDINEAEADGTTALEVAVHSGNVDLVRHLLSAGANVNTATDNGKTLMFSLDDESTPELVQILINAGLDVNQADGDGETPLINAAEWDDADLIKSLIDAGAYVNAQNSSGNSALMVAAEQGNAETLKVLLAAGAIYGLRNTENIDAMQLAKQNSNQAIVDLLLDAGAVPEDVIAPPTDIDSVAPSVAPAVAMIPEPRKAQ